MFNKPLIFSILIDGTAVNCSCQFHVRAARVTNSTSTPCPSVVGSITLQRRFVQVSQYPMKRNTISVYYIQQDILQTILDYSVRLSLKI